jgi:hypothetical protein
LPTIRADTDRGLRVLPGLDARQAGMLGATAAGCWFLLHLGVPPVPRAILALGAAVVGGGLVLGRWPLDTTGEPAGVWLWRWLRYVAQPRRRHGAAVGERLGVAALRTGVDPGRRRPGSLFVCEARDHAAGGIQSLTAAQAAYLEFLQALDGPVQMVLASRRLTEVDRPAAWDPEGAPDPLGRVAASYARHWTTAISGRLLQRSVLMALAPSRDPAAPPLPRAVPDAAALWHSTAARLDIATAPIPADRWPMWWRAFLGAEETPSPWPPAGFWAVTRATEGDGLGTPPMAGPSRAAGDSPTRASVASEG